MISRTHAQPQSERAVPLEHRGITHAIWFSSGVIGGFFVPFVFSSLLDLHHDLYYLIYFAATGAFLGAYVRRNEIDIRRFLRASIWPSLIVGVPITLFLVFNVLNRDATARPDGAYFVFEIGWRGLMYGVVDALLLTAFPALAAFGLLGDKLAGIGNRLRFAGLVLIFTMVITGAYHLGYQQFRDDGIGQPEIGNVMISLSTMATGNPAGSILAHGAMHVAAVTHSYETDVFLPPQTDVD